MLIEFKPEIFDDVENLRKLTFLLGLCFIDRRYSFFIDIDKVGQKVLFNSLSKTDQELIEEYYLRSFTESKKPQYFISNSSSDNVFDLDEARAFLNQPLLIVLENSEHDSYFIEAIVNNFKTAKILKRHLTERWARFDNGGGYNNIENVLNRHITSYGNLPKPPQKYLRCFVLVDSDSKYPGDLKADRNQLIEFLEGREIPFHILQKREMENYMPDEVMSVIPDNDEYLAAYLRLTPQQKDYFDISDGLYNKNFSQLPLPIQNLFDSVNENDRKIFRQKTFTCAGSFKANFPKYFKHENVTKETLNRRIAHQEGENEYEIILKTITSLL